jgi:hypothetical protein
MQPLDVAWFHGWWHEFERSEQQTLLTHNVGYKSLIAHAYRAYRKIFPLGTDGSVIPNR